MALLAAATISVAPGTLVAQQAGVPQTLPETPLTIATETGTHTFSVMVADDAQERTVGLMFRETMDLSQGMLFVFPNESPRAFWMRNTPLSLDIIFIDDDGQVVNVAKRTTPFSLESVLSEGEAQFVLELKAGVSDLIRLKPGDQVKHPVING